MFIIFRGYMVIHRSFTVQQLPCRICVSKKNKNKVFYLLKYSKRNCKKKCLGHGNCCTVNDRKTGV